MANFLAVPIRVDGLYSPGRSAVQALADFSFLPYRDDHPADKATPRDLNGEVGYISENFVAQPFSDENFWLPKGLHLHWALPDALTVGRHPRNTQGEPDVTRHVEYPSVPNRWLVVLKLGGTVSKKWIVESDYLHSPKLPYSSAMPPVSYPLKNPLDGEPPFGFLGRTRQLAVDYSEDMAATTDYLYRHGETLTAPGYGEPNFHAFYPSCHSVLGLYDDTSPYPVPADREYLIFGWYGIRADDKVTRDPLRQLIDDFNAAAPAGYKSREAFVRRILNLPDKDNLESDPHERLRKSVFKKLKDEEYKNTRPEVIKKAFFQLAFTTHLQREFDWQIDVTPDANNQILIDGLVCCARLTFSGSAPVINRDAEIKIAVGNTGAEALAAFLSDELAGRDADKRHQVENQLESLTLTPQLKDQTVDLGPKFEETSHNGTFTAVNVGTLWNLRAPLQDRSQVPLASQPNSINLPDEIESPLTSIAARIDQRLAEKLADLNQLQLAYDRGLRVIRWRRRNIYSDWYKYMVCCYRPPDTGESDYPEVDEVKRLIEKEVVKLYLTQVFVGQLKVDVDSNHNQVSVTSPPLDMSLFHLAKIPGDSISGLGIEMLRGLPPVAGGDSEAAILCQSFFEKQFSSWCSTFVAGTGQDIPVEMIDILGSVIYDAADHGYLARYEEKKPTIGDKGALGAFKPREFASVAMMVARQITGLAKLADGLAQVHAAATAVKRDVNAIIVAIKKVTSLELFQADKDLAANILQIDSLKTADAEVQKAFAERVATLIPGWLLQPTAAPRFWQPNEPVVLLAGPGVPVSDRHDQDGTLSCPIINQDVRGAQNDVVGVLNTALFGGTPVEAKHTHPFVSRTSDANPYHPLFLEWQVGVLPVDRHGNVSASARRYHRNFVRENYKLEGNRREFLLRGQDAMPTASTSVVVGRSILSPRSRGHLQTSIDQYLVALTRRYLNDLKSLSQEQKNLIEQDEADAYLDYFKAHTADLRSWCDKRTPEARAAIHAVIDAKAKLEDQNLQIQSQALTGFNAALLMQRQTLQLPLGDPLAFPDYRDFTEAVVRDAVADQNHVAPEPLFDFEPIRTGYADLMRLRLVDSFGLAHSLPLNQIIRSQRMECEDAQTGFALPARLTQPARVNFRWLSAYGDWQQTNSHALTSPICGWLVANRLDGSLMVHDSDGLPLGYLDETGHWRSPPGGGGPVLPEDINNSHLARMVRWICASARKLKDELLTGIHGAPPSEDDAATRFINDFMKVVDTALLNIEPQNFRQHEARALLMSRPLALVRATVDLQLPGPAATHNGWEPFRRRLLGQPAKTDQYLDVAFPVRIGEHRQMNDGVVGYWLERDGDYLSHYSFTAEIVKRVKDSAKFQPLIQTHPDLPDKLTTLVNQSWFGTDTLLAEVRNTLYEARITLSEQDFGQLGSLLLSETHQGEFLAPQSDTSKKPIQDRNFVLSREGGPAPNFHQSLADAPQLVSILMDPRGLVHCTTGVLPTKTLTIPPEHYGQALKNLNVTFLSAPLLSDPARVNIPLPQEPGYEWSWWQRDGSEWTEIITVPMVYHQALLDAFADGALIWNALLESNWLAEVEGDRAMLVPKNQRKPLPPPWDEKTRSDDIQRVLDLAERVLGQPPDEARFGSTQEIREGWLQLTPR